MPHPTSQLLAAAAYTADYKCRVEMNRRVIPDERTYVASLTTRISDVWNRLGFAAFNQSFVLNGSQERMLGCDAVILLHLGDFAKVCLLEAKWPRALASSPVAWDYDSSGVSHFSSQLKRQSQFANSAAIFELFIIDSPPGSKRKGVDLWGATCTWHDETIAFDIQRGTTIWDQAAFWQLVTGISRRDRSLWYTLRQVAECQVGTRLAVIGDSVRIQGTNGYTISFPTNLDRIQRTNDNAISLPELGISEFLYLDLGRFEAERWPA